MFVIVAGGGKVGSNVARTLLRLGHEAHSSNSAGPVRAARGVRAPGPHGDATELYVLERAGIARPADIVIAVTGDDEDNLVIGQLAKEKYGVERVIARVNDPRNQPLFDLLGIAPTVSATVMVLGLVEHEVPEHELVHLLELRKEGLEIVEVEIDQGAPCAGKTSSSSGSRKVRGSSRSCATAPPRSPSGRPSSSRATRCSRSSSPARKTSCES